MSLRLRCAISWDLLSLSHVIEYELTSDHLPVGLDSSLVTAPVIAGSGFDSRSSLKFFSGLIFTTAEVVCITAMVIHIEYLNRSKKYVSNIFSFIIYFTCLQTQAKLLKYKSKVIV